MRKIKYFPGRSWFGVRGLYVFVRPCVPWCVWSVLQHVLPAVPSPQSAAGYFFWLTSIGENPRKIAKTDMDIQRPNFPFLSSKSDSARKNKGAHQIMPIFRGLYKVLFSKTSGAKVLIECSKTVHSPYKMASWRVIFLSGALRTVGAKGREKVGGIGVRAFRASCGLGGG